MKKFLFIITFGFLLLAAPAFAAKPDETPEPVKKCLEKHAVFKFEEGKPYFPFGEAAKTTVNNASDFQSLFSKTRDAYHDYIQCVFDESTKMILGSTGADTDGFWSANTPNIPEFLRPEASCLTPDKLKAVTENTSAAKVTPFVLQAYNVYSAYLLDLYAYNKGKFSGSPDFGQIRDEAQRTQLQVSTELQDSMVALHTTFRMFTELRQVFILHVQLQCMLKNLQEYERWLGELRKVITLLPGRIIDASMSK